MTEPTDEIPLDAESTGAPGNRDGETTPTPDAAGRTTPSETEIRDVAPLPYLPHPPKKWKDYFLDFLMLFLAVTLGFFAENIREYFNNEGIEKRNIELVVDNLRDDVENIKRNIAYNEEKLRLLDTLISFKNTTNLDTLHSERFSYLVTKSIYNPTFYSNTAAIDQMKYSGSLRLIKNKEILSGIFKYEGLNEYLSTKRAGIVTDDDRWVENASAFLDMQNLASTRGLQFLENSPSKPEKHLAHNQQNIFIFFNHAILRKSILEMMWLPQMRNQQKNAEALIALLEKEYGIKDGQK
jgi:hypothetical protein